MGKGKTPLAAAQLLADHVIKEFGPHCERIEIAGSIRREKPEVGDIELLYVPRYELAGNVSMFGEGERVDVLDRYVRSRMPDVFEKRLNVAGNPIGYGDKNKALVHKASGVGVDLFATEPRYWGMSMVVRTGPAELNVRMMQRFQQRGLRGHAYAGVTDAVHDKEYDCPDEDTVFKLLGWDWIEPKDRA